MGFARQVRRLKRRTRPAPLPDPKPTTLNRRNVYTCSECYGEIVTIDIHEGVTPFMVRCRATDGCRGMMHSSFYQPGPQHDDVEPGWEWYSPDADERRRLDRATLEQHVERGGLLLRKRLA